MNIVDNVKSLFSEHSQVQNLLKDQSKEIDYLRQKENKLMYLFFILHRKGVDVNEVYESELKDVPTERFNEWIKEHMNEDEPPEISFDSQASYSPILEGPFPKPKRPKIVPALNLVGLPEYETSSDEEDDNNNESSSVLKHKNSEDGSKLNRKSEFGSQASLSLSVKAFEDDKIKEDYSLKDLLKINNRTKGKFDSGSTFEPLGGMQVSQSLNTDQINFLGDTM